jgi:hypothetical protein
MAVFKNKTKEDFFIPDVGLVRAGEEKEMPEGFNNSNFEKVEKTQDNKTKK